MAPLLTASMTLSATLENRIMAEADQDFLARVLRQVGQLQGLVDDSLKSPIRSMCLTPGQPTWPQVKSRSCIGFGRASGCSWC